jgi:hypothetical protein
MKSPTKRSIQTVLNERQKADAAVRVLAALLSNPQVLSIDLQESPADTARKMRRCVQLSWDVVRDLNKELLFQLRSVGNGVNSEDVAGVATRFQ